VNFGCLSVTEKKIGRYNSTRKGLWIRRSANRRSAGERRVSVVCETRCREMLGVVDGKNW
jgi:hypothetical protein